MNERSQLKIGALLSYLQMALGIVIGLAYTPVMIRLLGDSEYGLYNTVSSTIALLSILELGFTSGYILYYSRYKKQNDRPAIDRLNGLYMLIFSVLGVIALACGLYLSENLHIVFDEGLTAGEYRIARILMILLSFNLALSLPMSVFVSIISAHEKYICLKLVNILRTVMSPLVTLPLLLMGYRSVAMVVITLACYVVADSIYVWFVLFRLKERFTLRGIRKKDFTGLFAFTFFIAINLLVDQINWNVDKILLGRYRGTTAVGIYAVGYTLYTYYQMFSTAISGVFTPRVHKLVNDFQHDEAKRRTALTDLFTKVGRLQFIVLGLISTGLLFFGKFFITKIWVGESYALSYSVLLLLMFPASISQIQNVGLEIQRALNRHKFRSIAYLIMAIGNFVMSYFLCQKYGVLGCAFGTAVSLVLANGILINIYYHKRCDVDVIIFWKSILRIVPGMLPAIVCGILLNIFLPPTSIWMFLVQIGAYGAVYCVFVYFIGMNRYEKNLLRQALNKVLRK